MWPTPRKVKIGKGNYYLRSQKYRFSCNQNANEALKSARSFAPKKKKKYEQNCGKKRKDITSTKAKQNLKAERRTAGNQAKNKLVYWSKNSSRKMGSVTKLGITDVNSV